MDPDQADAADDLADATAYEGGGCASGEESWARALLRRGWDLPRKAAIAGVAATAAPVVAPPIIILSIAGVALSVPFAACLASLVATDRLMGALLPPSPPQPCFTYDLRDEESEEEFVDASEAPDEEGPVFGYWSKTVEDAITEPNGIFASLPLSREPRLFEELFPLLANEEDDSAEGEFASQKSGHELFVPKDGKQKDNDAAMEVENDYITMEAPSRGDVSVSEVPVWREEDSIVWRMEDAPVPTMGSVQELSVSDNENKTEDGNSTITVENESTKEMRLPGLHTTESSDLPLPILGDDDVMVQRYVEGDVSVRKSGKDSHVFVRGDETEQHQTIEVMPPNEVSVSELQGLDDNRAPSKLEDQIAVDRAPQEEMRDTNPVTGGGVDVQLDDMSTAEPESEPLQSRHRVAPELQATTESAYVHGTVGSNLTEGIVKGADNKSSERVDDDKDLISTRSRLNVTAISDGMTSVGSKPHADHPSQTTCVANKEHGKEEVAEDKYVKIEESKTMDDEVPNTDMAAQLDRIYKSLVPDDQTAREDETTVEMVLKEITSSIGPVTGEVVEVEVDIIARESESLPLSYLVGHDSQMVTRAGMVGNKTEDIVKVIGDTNVVDVEHQREEGASSFVSAISDDIASVEGRPDLEHHHQTTGVDYKVMDRELETNVLAEDKDIYTEEKLRGQLNTLRTITGYRAVPSSTLEGELAGLYIFVGVESPHTSGGASDLTELSRKLRFLKSIIGVE